MDEHRWDDLAIELIGTLRTGDDGSAWQTLVVPQEILHEIGFTGLAFADEYHNLVVFDFRHVEFLQTQIQLP